MFVSAIGCLVGINKARLSLEIMGDTLLLLVNTESSVFLIHPQTFESLYQAIEHHLNIQLQEKSGDTFKVSRVLDKVTFMYPNHDVAIFDAAELAPVLAFLINAQSDDQLVSADLSRPGRRENDLELL